jgi:protein tyrosine phosphatase
LEARESDFVKNTDQITQLLYLANECADHLMNSFGNLCEGETNPQKLAITCKSGVGRTGTMMGLINCMICLKEQKDRKYKQLSIFSIVRRLREQRYELCKTRDQY